MTGIIAWIQILRAARIVSALLPPLLEYHLMSLYMSKYTVVVICLRSYFSMAALISLRWVLNLDISQASISPLGESDSDAMRSCTAPKILSTLCL